MLFIVILFIALCDAIESQSALKYLTKYEIVEFEILGGSLKDNSQEPVIENLVPYTGIEILLKADQKTFHLVLHEDEAFQKIKIQIQSPKSRPMASEYSLSHAKYYMGALKNTTSRSFVTGFVINDKFSGYIMEDDIEYIVETANFLVQNSTTSLNIMYNLGDISSENLSSDDSSGSSQWSLLFRTANIIRNASITLENIDLSSLKHELFCELEMVADHELYYFFRKDIDHLSAYIYFHVKFADRIFSQTDFTMDGEPDSVRLAVAKIFIYESRKEDNYPMATATDLTDYLMKFVYRKQESDFCLSVGMALRVFEGDIIGEAFRPDVNFGNRMGGICELPFYKSDTSETLYFNVAAINVGNKRGHLLPYFITLLALTHEVGHSFGSGHDMASQRICSPPAPFGKYIMHPKVLPRSKQNLLFSPCSRVIMGELISKKGGCLKQKSGSCGNGIREGDEECDCGHGTICDFIDPCCTPSDAPERGCTIRKQFQCSAKESRCCYKNCTIIQNTNVQCYSDGAGCLKTYCDGSNSKCSNPDAELLAFCRTKMVPCVGSNCSDSVCGSKGFKPCSCWHDLSLECIVCCRNGSRCVPASDLGILNQDGDDNVLQKGTPCNDGNYQCDGMGNCLDPKEHKSDGLSTLHVTVIVIAVVSTVLVTLVIHCYHKKVNLENLLLLRNHL